jgi:ribosomal protein S18 acetylase RimI-like enzyme
MKTMAIMPYVDALHRSQVVILWKEVFAYEAAHNNPGLVIDKKVEVDDGLFFVAVRDGTVVGTVMAGYDGHRGWLYSVAVAPSHRRQGIASRLVLHAVNELTRKGCVKINLLILEANQSVASFYASLGFSVEKCVIMSKRIPENIPSI